jgi:hypothetical protein
MIFPAMMPPRGLIRNRGRGREKKKKRDSKKNVVVSGRVASEGRNRREEAT